MMATKKRTKKTKTVEFFVRQKGKKKRKKVTFKARR